MTPARGPRVAGIDPGTVSFEVCGLNGGLPLLEESFGSAELGADPAPLVDALLARGPFDLVLGPAGYGLPLVPAAEVGERELALMVLKRADEPAERPGIAGMRTIIRALIAAGIPLVFGPGAIHLPTVPDHRKFNRVDLGTADKVASAALGIADQSERLGIPYEETRFVMLELGGGFSAALAVDGGRIVDGLGGSSGPIGARACGAMDGEAAYLIGGALSKKTIFSGGALDPAGDLRLGAPGALERLREDPRARDGWLAFEEGAAKAVLALTASVPAPREVLVAGRLALAPGLLDALAERLQGVAPVRSALAVKSAARGAALLADGLAGGSHAPLVACMRLREARGGVLDHLRMHGADRIALG
ncbi:MAG TPA: DUF1464 family protein [Baekduia sp.]